MLLKIILECYLNIWTLYSVPTDPGKYQIHFPGPWNICEFYKIRKCPRVDQCSMDLIMFSSWSRLWWCTDSEWGSDTKSQLSKSLSSRPRLRLDHWDDPWQPCRADYCRSEHGDPSFLSVWLPASKLPVLISCKFRSVPGQFIMLLAMQAWGNRNRKSIIIDYIISSNCNCNRHFQMQCNHNQLHCKCTFMITQGI